VIKTTVYLSELTKKRLAQLARRRKTSEANLIREGIERLVFSEPPAIPKPRAPLFSSGDPTLARRVDEELAKGFGRD
jgi:hypothetical protein